MRQKLFAHSMVEEFWGRVLTGVFLSVLTGSCSKVS